MKALQKVINKNLVKNFIKPLISLLRALIFFVKKKNEKLRLCVNYKSLNQITVKNRYTLPLIRKLINRLKNTHYFTKLDLKRAYNLVQITSGEWKLTFLCQFEHYKYRVISLGLTNALAFF